MDGWDGMGCDGIMSWESWRLGRGLMGLVVRGKGVGRRRDGEWNVGLSGPCFKSAGGYSHQLGVEVLMWIDLKALRRVMQLPTASLRLPTLKGNWL